MTEEEKLQAQSSEDEQEQLDITAESKEAQGDTEFQADSDFEDSRLQEDGEPQEEDDLQEDDEPQAEEVFEESTDEVTLESVIEAILFASDEALGVGRLAKIAETSTKQVRRCIKELNSRYRASRSAFRIEQIAGGYQMLTISSYNHWLKKLLRERSDSKLSPAALETLAIISYRQPIIRADIEAIRGVQAGEMIRSLMYKGLVKIVGRAEVLGRPMLYGTTKKFLEVFGLNTLKDLPKAEELKKGQ